MEEENVQVRQIKDAVANGLLIDVSTPTKASSPGFEGPDSPFSVLSDGGGHNIMDIDDGAVDFDGDDSDDDLL